MILHQPSGGSIALFEPQAQLWAKNDEGDIFASASIRDNIEVMGLLALYFLHSITKYHPIHLGYALANFIKH